ncbi:DUF1538 domain-containing protein [Tenuibacillus multivorans]|uniref:DUF1538 domain-containing protein n=1 Tax=Tenuibacillus multivorans TaxID=237069 RepID=A0A1H0EBQ4_9BACI|nr:DUF1538 domain-containing protein [Tenuibacillus multivorans]GEL78743.1 membrane protein [Tenuibacillus multivorans]SDN79746.1 Protein of unknown function [Tenuibacillus multivorans]
MVLILNFTITPLDTPLLIRFVLGAILIIIGLSIFLFGVDIGITPIGQRMGKAIAKTNKIWIILIAGILLGFFISIAEPDLHILADQVDMVTSGLISKTSVVVVVSIGIGLLIAAGLVRIVYNFPLYKLLTILYLIVFGLAIFTSPEFLAISFDASGATTGALTVPFILALALGISALKKDSKASEKDSFGLVAIASTGAIITVMIMNIISGTDEMTGSLAGNTVSNSIIGPFLHEFPSITFEITVALLPILIIFLVFQKISFKMSMKGVRKILMGLLFTFIGLVLFLVGVNAGFMDVGSFVGYNIANLDNKAYIIVIAFALGLVTILAEPAVYVLTHQIEDVTSGYVKRSAVLVTLSIGVGLAVLLSVLRVLIPELQLWHYLLPGYIIAIALTYVAPKLFVGIAFDSGGVASGPMTATFILAFVQGAAEATQGASVLIDGFGMIALVAMTPLIALQILGLAFKYKSNKAKGE